MPAHKLLILTPEQAQLAAENERLVLFLANKHFPLNVVQEHYDAGYVGLCKAAHLFDPTKGKKFSTFATPWILGSIKQHLRDWNHRRRAGYTEPPLSLDQEGDNGEERTCSLALNLCSDNFAYDLDVSMDYQNYIATGRKAAQALQIRVEEDLTQIEIAARLDISQVQVHRLLKEAAAALELC
jgi:RNA polymerase sigma factor (sigma-70 family)